MYVTPSVTKTVETGALVDTVVLPETDTSDRVERTDWVDCEESRDADEMEASDWELSEADARLSEDEAGSPVLEVGGGGDADDVVLLVVDEAAELADEDVGFASDVSEEVDAVAGLVEFRVVVPGARGDEPVGWKSKWRRQYQHFDRFDRQDK